MNKIIAFSENRLSPEISLGATGGPAFSTYIATTAKGTEQRNINWFSAKASYDIATGIKTSEHLEEIIELFRTCKGKAIGFRFKDWCDFKAANEKIGVGDSQRKQFQLMKTYTKGQCSDGRVIKKPVAGSVHIFVNNIAQACQCNFQTGLIELDKPPLTNEIITATFEFDVPVRFDIDQLNLSVESASSLALNPIPLLEVKV